MSILKPAVKKLAILWPVFILEKICGATSHVAQAL
jgi:hypothetical protein